MMRLLHEQLSSQFGFGHAVGGRADGAAHPQWCRGATRPACGSHASYSTVRKCGACSVLVAPGWGLAAVRPAASAAPTATLLPLPVNAGHIARESFVS